MRFPLISVYYEPNSQRWSPRARRYRFVRQRYRLKYLLYAVYSVWTSLSCLAKSSGPIVGSKIMPSICAQHLAPNEWRITQKYGFVRPFLALASLDVQVSARIPNGFDACAVIVGIITGRHICLITGTGVGLPLRSQ